MDVRYLDVDYDAFEKAYAMLNLKKQIGLAVDRDPPEALVESVRSGQISALDDNKLADQDVDEFLSQIFGAHSPLLEDDEDTVESHLIWVNPKAGPIMASISMVHEMVHAMQFETFGFKKYVEMDAEFMQTVGYSKNPFEAEADALAHYLVLAENIHPIVEVEA